MHAGEADDDAEILGELQPGSDVRVVIEPGAHDLVPALERPAERPREQEVERGHALPERDLVGMAGEEAAGGDVRAFDELDRVQARVVGSTDVRVVLAQVARDGVDHLVGALRPSRPVEEREPAVERGVAGADRFGVEHRRAQRSSSPFTVQ